MTNAISVFKFNQNQIRTEVVDGNPWFCLLDCCKALGIKNAATSVKLSEAGVGKTYCSYDSGKKEITIINEPNLYRLIFRSNKPQAQAFANWVYNEVLPSIRKTGSYGVPAPVDMKAIGGLVKKCCAVAVRDELRNILSGDSKSENWEVSDQDLIYQLYHWHNTKNKAETLAFRKLYSERDALLAENADLKNRMEQISAWVK